VELVRECLMLCCLALVHFGRGRIETLLGRQRRGGAILGGVSYPENLLLMFAMKMFGGEALRRNSNNPETMRRLDSLAAWCWQQRGLDVSGRARHRRRL
jgi:hypothetical protein